MTDDQVRTVWRLGDTGQALSISLPGAETVTTDRAAAVVTAVGPRRSEYSSVPLRMPTLIVPLPESSQADLQ